MKITTKVIKRYSQSVNIILDYSDLVNNKNFSKQIEQAYGKKGHGILFVKNIPDYFQTRKNLLIQSYRLATLPQDIKKKYTRPEIFHSLGWSCGVEQFHGKYDVSKGSFYSNCVRDTPRQLSESEKKFFKDQQLKIRVPNLWVDEIPEIQKYTKGMAKIMIHVGGLIARQIDTFVYDQVNTYPKNLLQNVIKHGTGHIGRLLHYFPFEKKETVQDDWCGWHNDHGAITSLTSALYVDKSGNPIQFKEVDGGLFAKNRFSQVAKISIPADMLAFQIGQSAQILTGGLVQATPHCVVRSQQLAGKGISRNTFALFMEPNELQKMSVPSSIDPKNAVNKDTHKIPPLQKRWDNNIFFKQFHYRTITYYS